LRALSLLTKGVKPAARGVGEITPHYFFEGEIGLHGKRSRATEHGKDGGEVNV